MKCWKRSINGNILPCFVWFIVFVESRGIVDGFMMFHGFIVVPKNSGSRGVDGMYSVFYCYWCSVLFLLAFNHTH